MRNTEKPSEQGSIQSNEKCKSFLWIGLSTLGCIGSLGAIALGVYLVTLVAATFKKDENRTVDDPEDMVVAWIEEGLSLAMVVSACLALGCVFYSMINACPRKKKEATNNLSTLEDGLLRGEKRLSVEAAEMRALPNDDVDVSRLAPYSQL